MDGSSSQYTKWNNSDRERQILYAITFMWNLQAKSNSEKKRSRMWLPEVEDGGVQISSYKMNKYEGCNVWHDDYG